MLELYMKENRFPNRKKPYSYFSRNPETVTLERFIDRIAEYNSTATKADALMIMTIMGTVFNSLIAEGYAVQLPMGTFRACASGTAENMSDRFLPKSHITDHGIKLHFRANSASSQYLRTSVKYTRIADSTIRHPSITHLLNEKKEITAVFHPGEYITVKGSFLMMDQDDSTQGIFLEQSENGSMTFRFRFSRYVTATKGTVQIVLPAFIPCGTYSLYAVSRPDRTVLTSSVRKITIAADDGQQSGDSTRC